MDVYANNIAENGIDLNRSKPFLDFGPGFYTTPDLGFAKNTAIFRAERYNRFASRTQTESRHPAVVVLEFTIPESIELKTKTFFKPDDVWGRFVVANRISVNHLRKDALHNINRTFDCVAGPTADGKAGNIDRLVNLIESKRIDLHKLKCGSISPSKANNWGLQYSFHTEKAISCLTVKDVIYYN